MPHSGSRLAKWIEGIKELQTRKDSQEYWLDGNLAEIQKRLVARGWFSKTERILTRNDVGAVSNRLHMLSFWYARQGLTEVWDGKQGGWQNIQRALLYRYWDARMFRSLWPNGSSDIFQLSHEALTFCHALAAGQDEIASWLGNDLLDQARPGRETSYEPGRIENFAVWLYGQWTRNPSCVSGQTMGVYEMISEAWDIGGEKLSKAVSLVLDWRMAHTNEDDPNDEKIEWGYDTQPYDFWPVEIIAMERILQEQGRILNRPDHPLLQTPLMNLPGLPVPMPHDPLIDRVLVAVREVYPDV